MSAPVFSGRKWRKKSVSLSFVFLPAGRGRRSARRPYPKSGGAVSGCAVCLIGRFENYFAIAPVFARLNDAKTYVVPVGWGMVAWFDGFFRGWRGSAF